MNSIFATFFKAAQDDEKKKEQAKAELQEVLNDLKLDKPPPVPVDEPPPVKRCEDVELLEDEGVITDVGKVSFIDDAHVIKLSGQELIRPLKLGERLRYTYYLKGTYRVIVKVIQEEDLPKLDDVSDSKCPVENWDNPDNAIESESASHMPANPDGEAVAAVEKASTDDNAPNTLTDDADPKVEPIVCAPIPLAAKTGDNKHWQGIIKRCVLQDGALIMDVLFDNGLVEKLELEGNMCSYSEPMQNDRIVVECLTEPSTDDEDLELLSEIIRVMPEGESTGAGMITDVQPDHIVIDENVIWFQSGVTSDGDQEFIWTVGQSVEFESIPFRDGLHQRRCLSVRAVDKSQKIVTTDYKLIINDLDNHKDREGLFIANRADLSFRFMLLNQTAEKSVKIMNQGQKTVRIMNVCFYSEVGRPLIRLKSHWRPINLAPKSEVDIRVIARARQLCNHAEYMIMYVNHDVEMVCGISVAVGSDEIVRSIAQHHLRYKRISNETIREREARNARDGTATEIFRAPRSTPKFIKTRLPRDRIPITLWNIMCGEDRDVKTAFDTEYPFLSDQLTADNYVESLRTMTFIAEAHLKKCFRIYDLDNARFTFDGPTGFYRLMIENLAECRPSVLLEDTIIARDGVNVYQAIIKRILHDSVLFHFNEAFKDDRPYKVEFRYNRGSFIKQLNAISLVMTQLGADVLFPEKLPDVEKEPIQDVSLVEDTTEEINSGILMHKDRVLPWVNNDLNVYQKRAIVNALRGELRPMPYIISGPPGTGKTSTLVELVLQVAKHNYGAHILICTPSNSAANIILQKLLETRQLIKDHLIRIIGYQVMENESIPEELLPYCGTVEISTDRTEGKERQMLESGLRINCQMEYLCDFRIIVSTIGSVGVFMQMGFPEGHFTHLFVDEAGQCLESEIAVPMSLLSKTNGQSVFVGDEKQLGPIVSYNLLKSWNYDVSLFERLQKFPLYDRTNEQWNPKLSAQLVFNYRSVPGVLKYYNKLFYASKLIPVITNPTDPEFLCLESVSTIFPVSQFRDRHCAVYFHAVKTSCNRTKHNPSWMNPGESVAVVQFYKKLVELNIDKADVGIISPYQEQVKVIRSYIDVEQLPMPKVGSVEEFQGQERMIILISTVRSNHKNAAEDERFSLGFVGHPKRINVAISRARAMVVVFGNPLLLDRDTNWHDIILTCQTANAYHEEPDHNQVQKV